MQGVRYTAMDGLRGFAAICVAIWHLSPEFKTAMQNTYLAVDMFFVLSGFVLAHAYLDRLQNGYGRLKFMTVRFVRLAPLFMAAMIAGFLHVGLFGSVSDWNSSSLLGFFPDFVLNMAFLPAIATEPGVPMFPANPPSWSLFYELVINGVMALVAIHLSPKRLRWLIGAFAIALVAATLYYGDMDEGFTQAGAAMGFARVGYCFFVGVALYAVSKKMTLRLSAVYLIPALAIFTLMFFLKAPEGWRFLFDIIATGLIIPATMLVASRIETKGVVDKVCEVSGRLSYGIYVFHTVAWDWMHTFFGRLGISFTPETIYLQWVIFIGGLLVGSWLMDAFFDRPLQKIMRGQIRTRLFPAPESKIA